MQIDATIIQDYVAGRLDAADTAAVAREVRCSSKIAHSVQQAVALTRRVERRLGAGTPSRNRSISRAN